MPRPSPLQNRVAPDGSLCAVPSRGLMMGNRGGRLHRDDRTLGPARWRSRSWIACRLAFRGRHRQVMGAGYTELFFLDEATALAAGHRPCFECRRTDARAFADAWARSQGRAAPPRAAEMDLVLHVERRAPGETVACGSLPAGAMFRHDGQSRLCAPSGPLAWSFEGYVAAPDLDPLTPVLALTPPTIRAALAAGYRPDLHPSAGAQFSAR